MNINNRSRVEDDESYLSQRNMYDVRRTDHLFQTPQVTCNDNEATMLAMSQPGIQVQTRASGCNQHIRLQSDYILDRGKEGLTKRPYPTVPYLGRGAYNPDAHDRLLRGDHINRNVIPTRDSDQIQGFPFIADVKNTVANPTNYIINDKWVRGGLPSRELYKDNTYRTIGAKN